MLLLMKMLYHCQGPSPTLYNTKLRGAEKERVIFVYWKHKYILKLISNVCRVKYNSINTSEPNV